MQAPGMRPTVVVPDTAPLIHLAAGGALDVLTGMGRVVIPDVVVMEATHHAAKPWAAEIAAWIEAGARPGSNAGIEVAESEFGDLYRLALREGARTPRNAGEIAIAAWLGDNLRAVGGPALVVYENGRVPTLLLREGVAAEVAVATTRNLLSLAQEAGLLPDAEAVWLRIVAAVPTANPASALTLIQPEAP